MVKAEGVKKTVLIIENDLMIQHIVTFILEGEGYTVIGTQHDTIVELLKYRADVILLDEWINKFEGHMICKDIKAVENFKGVPVIIFSTATDIAAIAKNCKADGFVAKPFDIPVLLSEIKRLLPLHSSSVA